MDESELRKLAFAIAEATPRHLDHPTTPPIRWSVEPDDHPAFLRVLLADGRTVRGPIPIVEPHAMRLPAGPHDMQLPDFAEKPKRRSKNSK